ncbi:MAG: hypothetical protein ACO1N0_19360 [Fluviicola sp.]
MKIFDELKQKEVVIVDDTPREVRAIIERLDELKIKNEYIEIDYATTNLNDLPSFEGVKLLFLDLQYGENLGIQFSPEYTADIVKNIIPSDVHYNLVVWTKDPADTDDVIMELTKINRRPTKFVNKKKETYRSGTAEYDLDRLFKEIEDELALKTNASEFFGKVIELEEDFILVDCRIGENYFQIRRFDKLPFNEIGDVIVGSIIKIKTQTSPGKREYEFFILENDAKMNELFQKKSHFDDLQDSIFLNGE